MSNATRGFAPRSLLRLVLVAFTVVLLPLTLLVIQNGRSLERVILLAQDGVESAVVDTRRASDMNDLALEMERAIRRYAVLENPMLRESYLRLLERYRLELEQLLLRIDGGDLGESLQHQLVYLADLAQANNEQIRERVVIFNAFNSTTLALDALTRAQIDDRIQQEREHVIVMRQQLWMLSAALGGASLLLALLFTYLIIRPVRQLEKRILNLGAGVYPEQVPIRGPAELVALGDKLHWLHLRLCELEAQKLQFLRHLSHELKTPLASLREGADLLMEQVTGPLNTDQQEVCELLVHNSFRLQELIEQLLDYNRIQQVQVNEEPVAVEPLLEQSLAAHRLTIDNKALQVSVELVEACPLADSHRLKLVLDNLISNAVNYADVAGVLQVNAKLSEQDYILTVANSGQPIPEQEQMRIFEPFVQGSQVRKGVLKGSGIGLSIAREAAENMGGKLILNTQVTDLVCFELHLPHNNNTGTKDE
ncbi:sensor histidine kinase [Oceanisphaera pacifica]|uniref:histidine kinase n=1 Tax=Oceanisphaera pacifica TaxID=2818389 RepID=A0ABS3NF61_9GAMM|nr:HAMP domain-containing sensor histidine kinase [Oceanisphaera pacifica]MBO1519224.1 HAMP domain-containing histidine kinase [Oceanisphaera pacifica]